MDGYDDRHHEDADDMHEAEIMSRFKARSRTNVAEPQVKPKVTKPKDFLGEEKNIAVEHVSHLQYCFSSATLFFPVLYPRGRQIRSVYF